MSRDRDSRRRLVDTVLVGTTRDDVHAGARAAGAGRAPHPVRSPWPVLTAGLVLALVLVGASAVLRATRPAATTPVDGDLLVSSTTGARYLDLDGRLHPVLNTASARLLVRSGAPRTVVVTQDVLASLPHGPTLGIPGAPDDLPPAAGMTGARWRACPVHGDVRVTVSRSPEPVAAGGPTGSTTPTGPSALVGPTAPTAVTVRVATAGGGDGTTYLLVGGVRLAQPPARLDALRDALGQPPTVTAVPGALLDLLAPGAPLAAGSLRLGPGLGAPLTAALRRPGVTRVGQLLEVDGSPGLLMADGLLPLDPFAVAVYAATATGGLGDPVPLSTADAAGLPRSRLPDPAPAEWPRTVPAAGQGVPCAELDLGGAGGADGASTASSAASSTGSSTTSSIASSTAARPAPVAAARLVVFPTVAGAVAADAGDSPGAGDRAPSTSGPAAAQVEPGTGSLVRVGPVAADGAVLLVDGTGTAYPVAAPEQETLSRLGYGGLTVVPVPDPWAALLPRGPALDAAAARRGPS